DGKFAVFVGGFPIVVDDEVVGGIGLSGGNGEQDTQCGVAALQALQELLHGHRVLVAADIKKYLMSPELMRAPRRDLRAAHRRAC
ncbi:heme-binding protein, partial [Acinetobacter baumannii]